jgi:hypothetical protein
VSVSLAVDGVGLGATLCGGTRSKVVGSVLVVALVGRSVACSVVVRSFWSEGCVFISRRGHQYGGDIDGRIPPPH